MAVWKVAPSLAAGCTAVLKPSELASAYVIVYNLFCYASALVLLRALICVMVLTSALVWSLLIFVEKLVFLLGSSMF